MKFFRSIWQAQWGVLGQCWSEVNWLTELQSLTPFRRQPQGRLLYFGLCQLENADRINIQRFMSSISIKCLSDLCTLKSLPMHASTQNSHLQLGIYWLSSFFIGPYWNIQTWGIFQHQFALNQNSFSFSPLLQFLFFSPSTTSSQFYYFFLLCPFYPACLEHNHYLYD